MLAEKLVQAITAPDVIVEVTSPGGAKAYFSPTATDAVGPVTLTKSHASGSRFPLGTTTVTVTATDGHGNTATRTFNVLVQDTTAPKKCCATCGPFPLFSLLQAPGRRQAFICPFCAPNSCNYILGLSN